MKNDEKQWKTKKNNEKWLLLNSIRKHGYRTGLCRVDPIYCDIFGPASECRYMACRLTTDIFTKECQHYTAHYYSLESCIFVFVFVIMFKLIFVFVISSKLLLIRQSLTYDWHRRRRRISLLSLVCWVFTTSSIHTRVYSRVFGGDFGIFSRVAFTYVIACHSGWFLKLSTWLTFEWPAWETFECPAWETSSHHSLVCHALLNHTLSFHTCDIHL